ncbi:MAG: hypothetical protein LBR07_04395 [Puniceicoccales bacterium]|jgi:hypothetical protein|nr:hypothetical protein [Puniceicoccales bacterium]
MTAKTAPSALGKAAAGAAALAFAALLAACEPPIPDSHYFHGALSAGSKATSLEVYGNLDGKLVLRRADLDTDGDSRPDLSLTFLPNGEIETLSLPTSATERANTAGLEQTARPAGIETPPVLAALATAAATPPAEETIEDLYGTKLRNLTANEAWPLALRLRSARPPLRAKVAAAAEQNFKAARFPDQSAFILAGLGDDGLRALARLSLAFIRAGNAIKTPTPRYDMLAEKAAAALAWAPAGLECVAGEIAALIGATGDGSPVAHALFTALERDALRAPSDFQRYVEPIRAAAQARGEKSWAASQIQRLWRLAIERGSRETYLRESNSARNANLSLDDFLNEKTVENTSPMPDAPTPPTPAPAPTVPSTNDQPAKK